MAEPHRRSRKPWWGIVRLGEKSGRTGRNKDFDRGRLLETRSDQRKTRPGGSHTHGWKENDAHKILSIFGYYNINKLVNGDFLGCLSASNGGELRISAFLIFRLYGPPQVPVQSSIVEEAIKAVESQVHYVMGLFPQPTMIVIVWALVSSLILSGLASPAPRTYDTHNYYVLRHISSAASLAEVVQALNVELVEQAGELQDHWIVRQLKPQENILPRSDIDPVLSAFQALKTRAELPLTTRNENTLLARQIVSSVDYLSHQTLRRRVKRAPPSISPPADTSSHGLAARLGIQDPMFSQQWHLVNDDFPQHMMNVTGVWDMGFKGKGVISSLVDDGLDYESEDLSANFVRTTYSTNLYLYLLTFGYRMPMTLTILMTTKPYQLPKTLMITMELDAPAKLQRKRITFVASVSHTNRKLQVFASYPGL